MGWTDYVPGVSNIQGLYNGDVKQALFGVNYAGPKAAYNKGRELYGDAKDAINAPYEKSREGFDVILGRLGELKNERLKRKDDLYARANSQYDDTRNAMAQVYGDPRMWRL